MKRFNHTLSLSELSRVRVLALSHDTSKVAFYVLLALIVCVGVFYAYFVNQTVLSVVARKDIEERKSLLSADLALLEFEYLEKKNNVTIEYARGLGMTEVTSKKFVTRNTGSLLTMRN